MFRSAIATLLLCDASAWSALDTDGLAQLYDKEITTILDQLIPMRTVRFRRRASHAWFDDDCRVAKRCVRQFERDVRRIRRADPQNTTAIDAATARPLSRAAVRFPAGADQIRLARRRADLRRQKFGWRQRQTFPAAEFGASS